MSFNGPGSRACPRALEALGIFFFAEYAFSLFSRYLFVIFQYSDARRKTRLLTFLHLCAQNYSATWNCLLSVGNAVSTAYLF